MSAKKPHVVIYTRPWCGSVLRVKRWLYRNAIDYTEIDISKDQEAARYVEELNDGHRSVPTLLIDGKHVATEPSTAELEKLFR
jgi:mycoredoxin